MGQASTVRGSWMGVPGIRVVDVPWTSVVGPARPTSGGAPPVLRLRGSGARLTSALLP